MAIGIGKLSGNFQDYQLTVERNHLSSPTDVMEWLSLCIPDRSIQFITENPGEIVFRISIPKDVQWYRDPEINEHLGKMGREIQDLALFYHWGRGRNGYPSYFWSFNHCWALHSFSLHWPELRSLSKLTVIHLDAHEDLERLPFSFNPRSATFSSVCCDQIFKLGELASTSSAISYGLVGIGSFMLPLFAAVPSVDFIHVVPNELLRSKSDRSLFIKTEYDGMLLKTERSEGPSHRYFPLGIHSVCPSNISTPILLDIDLDFFCNALDDRLAGFHTSSDQAVYAAIERTARLIRHTTWFINVIGISVALSPGFFPARLWSTSLSILEEELFTQGYDKD